MHQAARAQCLFITYVIWKYTSHIDTITANLIMPNYKLRIVCWICPGLPVKCKSGAIFPPFRVTTQSRSRFTKKPKNKNENEKQAKFLLYEKAELLIFECCNKCRKQASFTRKLRTEEKNDRRNNNMSNCVFPRKMDMEPSFTAARLSVKVKRICWGPGGMTQSTFHPF
jgi:hypothetical protein